MSGYEPYRLYEIIVFESQDIYDYETATNANVLKKYLEACRKYVSPEYLPESETRFSSSMQTVSYCDRSGGDKPCIVLLVGAMTDALKKAIQEGLQEFYRGNKFEDF